MTGVLPPKLPMLPWMAAHKLHSGLPAVLAARHATVLPYRSGRGALFLFFSSSYSREACRSLGRSLRSGCFGTENVRHGLLDIATEPGSALCSPPRPLRPLPTLEPGTRNKKVSAPQTPRNMRRPPPTSPDRNQGNPRHRAREMLDLDPSMAPADSGGASTW